NKVIENPSRGLRPCDRLSLISRDSVNLRIKIPENQAGGCAPATALHHSIAIVTAALIAALLRFESINPVPWLYRCQ
ncbi:MAG: hypothetical protein Q6J33_08285, partial [Gloeomargarita sp. DG_2_bins_126]